MKTTATAKARRGLGLAIGASIVGHLGLMLVLPRIAPRRSTGADDLTFVEMTVEAPPPEPTPPPEPVLEPPAPEQAAPEIAPAAIVAVARDVAPTPSVSTVIESPVPTVSPTETPAVVVAPTPSPVPNGVRLDPRSVALSVVDLGGPRVPTPQAQQDTGETTAERDRRLTGELNAHLGERANRRDYLTQRDPPQLVRQDDGSYLARGSGTSLRLDPVACDVHFSDRPGAQFEGFGNAERPQGMQARFDFTDAMMRRHGDDPLAAERRFLLAQTEDERNRLCDEHRAERIELAARRVRGQLQRLFDNESRSIEQRRAAIFRVWDRAAEDEAGEAVRRAVLAFVRERLPQGSELAYPGEEIARLNARRESEATFQPY